MGKATRWLKGLLGMKKDKENVDRNPICEEKREKKRWSFAKAKDSGPLNQIPVNIPTDDSAWLRSFIVETEKDQNEHAMAVAAATAAAADAAVAAAQAAVAVVRLTSQGKGGHYTGGREIWASVKIQTMFRGFLARKALRALKGLVKLQALVRGFLVRKRAAATLHSMQALFRAQVAVRTERARRSISNEARFRRPHERVDEFNSRRLSSSYDRSTDESPKIVEIDTYGPKSRSRRINTCMTEYDDDQYYQAVSSPLPCPVQTPARLSIPDHRNLQDFDWGFVTEDYKFPTAQNTPRFSYTGRANAPVTPVKSVCGDGLFRPYSYHPSYMANTQSFRAKVRSYSAPKQRPEAGPKKGLSLNEMMAARSSFSGVGMQRTSHQVREDFEI